MNSNPLKAALVFVVTLSQIIILVGFLTYKNLNSLLGSWSQTANLSVYLKTDILDEERTELQKKIQNHKFVSHVDFVNRQQAAQDFEKSLGSYATGLLTVDEMIDLVPETLVVSLSDELAIDSKIKIYQSLTKTIQNFAGVEEVSFGADWLNQFAKFDQFIRTSGFFSLFVLLVVMSFLSILMIRVMIEDLKPEIDVYQLVGATKWFIYKRFIKQISLLILMSLGISLCTVYGLFYYFKEIYFKNEISQLLTEKMIFFKPNELAFFISIILIIVLASSFFSMQTTLKKLNQFNYE